MSTLSLKNHFLIAMPNLKDPNFTHSVTFLLAHDEKGAMGVIINKPLIIKLGEILKHLNIPYTNPNINSHSVLMGGPIAEDQGFIIHTRPELEPGDIIDQAKKITLSGSRDVLEVLSKKGLEKTLVCLGHSGWGPGQLEKELANNSWIHAPLLDTDILFKVPFQQRWRVAAASVGVDFNRLSHDIGHG